ncbi:sperm motility kinase X-like, partial [Sigmodon hispidus]
SSFVNVRQQIFAANFNVPSHFSIDIFNVIISLLIINPGRRPAISQVMRSFMIRGSEAHSPTTSTQNIPGTLSSSIVKTMKVMGYKLDDILESLRDQKYNQVMVTYLILQDKSPGGDLCQNQVKPIQPGLALNLADIHTFPVPLRRATEPAPSTFTLQSKPQKEEDKKKTRQGGTRNSMPATVCYQPKRTLPPHLSYPDCPVNYWSVGSNLKIIENFTQSKIAVCSSLMATVHTCNSMFTSSHWSDQNESTGDTGNMSACSP